MENKSKILYLYKLLDQKTDQNHPIGTTEIIKELGKIGINVTRKTVVSDIALLIEFGVDIINFRSSQNMYYIGSRDFELAEIKLLVDAIESSKLVTHKKSNVLISKLSKLVSIQQAKELNRHIFVDQRVKPQNENVYYIIDLLHQAIADKKQVDFKYIDYTGEKEKIFKHNGMVYKVSPYALIWNDDHYYVVGFCSNHKSISKFRVDRMDKVKTNEETYVPSPEDFSAASYVKTIFSMYDGNNVTVELKCTNDLMKAVIDKFGEHVETIPLGSNCFKAIVNVSVSPTFYGWIFQFQNKVSILAPFNVKDEYKNTLKVALESMGKV